ncbi:uncharacterized protein PGTG_06434 [Puccinia graminis f. sp. tritici CRL 75-36-700-3]|uniref:Nitrogen regulatory protein areA GATA-like domain-containing protein n=1 Tax=Puccinia graminis f. sp. tritici (strain CRL 75-36-700-3 / race SCCL) TaxID=418459 RepID=E3K7I7_PUCGT|nr:uncharacterized protein PGTG_06434 [Puccinia graminis f. sp. tritici CRL 75-36-700-3]EFP80478.2 hypothetical protein PGTG_06434 [Puccinia graminis f. sp. tritici CRL 75-36-700-3]
MNLTINLKDELPIGTLWLAFSRSKPIIQDGHRLENLSWRLWQRELKQNNSQNSQPTHQLHHLTRPTTAHNTFRSTPHQLSPHPLAQSSLIITTHISPSASLHSTNNWLLSPPATENNNNNSLPSDSRSSSSYFTLQQPSRPSIDQHYSSGSNTSSSLATSPSIQAPPDNHLLQDHNKHIKQTVDRPKHTAHNLHPLPRRATSSTATFKHKRRPPVPTRLHSHQSTTRSVSPRLVQPYYCRRSSLPSSSPEQVQEPPKPLDPSHPTQLITSPSSVTHPHSSQNHPPQPSLAHDPDSQITLSAGYNSSGSLPSLVSPIIPETPNNSQVSAPLPTH